MKKTQHLAVIMDGNRRWAKNQGRLPFEGHKAGVNALRQLVKVAPDYGIEYLTAYAFSTENWKRTEKEIEFLFKLLKEVSLKELESLHENNVKVRFIGGLNAFPKDLYEACIQLQEKTQANTGLNLQIALNYGSIDEVKNAVNSLKEKLKQGELDLDYIKNLNQEGFSKHLYTSDIPDPDIVLRTGGEHRLSNYLLWQAADAELVFIDTLWPDLQESDLKKILKC